MVNIIGIPLACIRPTEYLIAQDKLEVIGRFYKGTIESIKPVKGYWDQEDFYLEDGNKRSFFLFDKGKEYILAYEQDHDTQELAVLKDIAARCVEKNGVWRIEDLEVVTRQEYDRRIE